ncbi:MAG: ATP-binding protein [Deinococcota bacterium]
MSSDNNDMYDDLFWNYLSRYAAPEDTFQQSDISDLSAPTNTPNNTPINSPEWADLDAQMSVNNIPVTLQRLLETTERIAQIGGWVLDLATGDLTWSDEVYRLHDLPVGSTLNIDEGLSYYPEGARERLEAAIDQAVTNIEPYDLELPFISAAGTAKWVRAIGRPVLDQRVGKVVRLWGVVQDITKEKRTRLGFAEQRAFLESIIDAVPSQLMIVDRDSNYLLVNRAKAAAAGTTPEQMVGRNSREFFPTNLVNTWNQDNPKIFDDGISLTNDYEDQRGRHISSLRFPVRNAQGNIIGKGALGLDITARKRAEEALKQDKEQAESANRVKSMFIANVSHELRTPLTSVLGFAELLKEANDIPEHRRKQINTLYDSGHYLLTLINDVLELSKFEAGQVDLNPDTVDLRMLLIGLYEMFEVQASSKGINLSFDLQDAPKHVFCDANKLRQILINLLGNAVKFTQDGSVSLQVQHLGDNLHYAIQDTGPGIASHDLPQLFEPFVQLKKGKKHGGSGLGLSITKRFVDAMGGTIEVSSREGHGSTFRLILPYQAPQQAVKDSTLETSPNSIDMVGQGAGHHILVADDVEATYMLINAMLRPLGFHISHAKNGREALEIALSERPKLVLMDIAMPEMNGLEATQAIRKALGNSITIIALTASVFEEGRQQVLEAGCDEFLHKPFSRDTLLQTVVKYFRHDHVTPSDAPTDVPLLDKATSSQGLLINTSLTTTPSDVTTGRQNLTSRDSLVAASTETDVVSNSLVANVAALSGTWRETLLELLSVGDVTAALDHVQTLADDPKHASVVAHLSDMLSLFQLDEILELLERANTI